MILILGVVRSGPNRGIGSLLVCVFSGGGLPLLFFSQFFQDKLNVKRCRAGVKLNVFSSCFVVREVGFEPTNPCGTGTSSLRFQGHDRPL